MNVLLTFEVSDKLDQVRQHLSGNGYMSSWKVQRGSKDVITYYLPSNVMWKKGKEMSPTKAKEELKKVATKLNIKIIRAVAITVGKFDGVTGSSVSSSASVAESVEAES